jgi:ATP-dependent Lon protease
VLIPEENAKDLVEISDTIKKGLEIVPVTRMDEVLARALVRPLVPITWDEEAAKLAAAATAAEPAVDEDGSGLTAH